VGVDGFAQAPTLSADDAFCLDGLRLMPVGPATISGQSATIRYRTEEDRFTDVSASFNATTVGGQTVLVGPVDFTARAKDGRVFTYAKGILSRAAEGSSLFQTWAVTKVADRTGNAMVITYNQDSQMTDAGLLRDYFPRKITYGSQLAVSFAASHLGQHRRHTDAPLRDRLQSGDGVPEHHDRVRDGLRR
jgi:hypothetical protein